MPRLTRCTIFLLLACTLPTAARDVDGTLHLIQTPNNGVPQIIVPGESMKAVLTHEAALSLVHEEEAWPLDCDWSALPGDMLCASCRTPDTLAPGCYALAAETDTVRDRNERAVYVVESFPEHYFIAHVTDTHIGTTRHPRTDTEIIGEVVDSVNESEAAFVLITGDLTENGAPEQFRLFLELLDRFVMPVFVVPGNHDRQNRHYESFFGPLTYAFQFGSDGYLGFDTKDYFIADELGPQDGALHRLRRLLRPSRWSVGFTHRYDVTMGMRAQLILFVDDPLDYLIYGHYHREAGEQDGIPWGKTSIIMTPAAINGYWRLIGVDAQGVHIHETIRAASTGREDAPRQNY